MNLKLEMCTSQLFDRQVTLVLGLVQIHRESVVFQLHCVLPIIQENANS